MRELVRQPRLLDMLALTPHLEVAKPPETISQELRARLNRLDADERRGLLRTLRRHKYREMLRLCLRDLGGRASVFAVAQELSDLASAQLDLTARQLFRNLVAKHGSPQKLSPDADGSELGFVVLGMGKLGARELNFSSDVDVIFLYATDGQTRGGPEGALTHLQFYGRLAEQLTAALSEATADGFVCRVDLNLRPDGRSGPIVNSLDAAEHYYQAFGRTWERVAMLRARPVGGDLELGENFLKRIEPFVFRKSLDFSVVEELRAQKAQIDRKANNADDLKLGQGGIREVEFFVQALQLLTGGRKPRLRERATLPALDKLLFEGLLRSRDRDVLANAYAFLRRAEHRVQMVNELQTHRLPEDEAALLRLAKQMGFDEVASFKAALDGHRHDVHVHFGDLLKAAQDEPLAADPRWFDVLDPERPTEFRTFLLNELGLRDADAALASIERLARKRELPFALSHALPAEALTLLSETLASPDPDAALFHLAELFGPLTSPRHTYDLLARHPQTARLLLALFGTSEFLSRYFLRNPELLEVMVRADATHAHQNREAREQELSARLTTLADASDVEAVLTNLGRFKNEEVLRIGLNDVGGHLDVLEVGRQLSLLAEVLLEACLHQAESELQARYGTPTTSSGERANLCVIAMGKLGGSELGYHSDLDLLMLYSGQGETRGNSNQRSITLGEYFTRLAQRLLSHLSTPLREGALYRTDTRLRPSGNQGALVTTVDAFVEHHLRRAQLWEHQALLKARPVSGDRTLWTKASEAVRGAVFDRRRQPQKVANEIDAMRVRMEREIASETRHHFDPKVGHGGLVDVEFATQYLQLVHGANDVELWEPNTLAALSKLARLGALSSDDATFLHDAYVFLRRLENRLRIVKDFHLSRLPRAGRDLGLLARRLGYEGSPEQAGPALLADYQRSTLGVRLAYRRLLGLPPS